MMLLQGLRLFSLLAFYDAFAGFFAFCFGGSGSVWVLLWPAVCFAAASHFSQNKLLRIGAALAGFAALPFLSTLADQLVYLPAAVYGVILAAKGDFSLSPAPQEECFRWLYRVWPFFGAAMLLWNADAVLAALPTALAAAALLVWYARTARQDPEVCTQPASLLVSGGALAAVCGVSFLLSRTLVVEGARTVLSALYFRLIVPVLQLVLNNVVAKGIVGMFQSVWLFVAWVLSLFARQSVARGDLYESSADSLRNAMEDNAAPLVNGPQVLAVLGGILAAAVLVFVLYRLIRRKKEAPVQTQAAAMVRHSVPPRARRWTGLFLSPSARIRREYRAYLAYCETHGVTILRGDTSLDLTGRAHGMDHAAEAELREIYLRARYAGTATAEDAARAEELVRKIYG